jgi:hypothetical protein
LLLGICREEDEETSKSGVKQEQAARKTETNVCRPQAGGESQ